MEQRIECFAAVIDPQAGDRNREGESPSSPAAPSSRTVNLFRALVERGEDEARQLGSRADQAPADAVFLKKAFIRRLAIQAPRILKGKRINSGKKSQASRPKPDSRRPRRND